MCSRETSHQDTHLSTQNLYLILTNIFIISHRNVCSVCSKETSRWDASFELTKHTSARKISIQLQYALTFHQSVCSVCSKETSPWDAPSKQTEDNPAWRITITSQIHTLASKQSNTQTLNIYQNVPCSVCSRETSHQDTHLSTQNLFLILTNIFIISHPKVCSVCSKETSQWDASFELTKHKISIQLQYSLTFHQSVCSVCSKETWHQG